MGIEAGKKNSEDQEEVNKVAYPSAASVASHKNARVPNHNHRSLFDEKYSHEIRFNTVRRISKISRNKAENGERNGHPETNAAPRDVKSRKNTPRLRRAPIMLPIFT